jgi:hypothetical protein
MSVVTHESKEECVYTLRLSSLCVIAQGAKTVIVGQEVYHYDTSRMIVFSVALPVANQVTQASYAEPYLSLKLDLDPRKIAELGLEGLSERPSSRSGEKRGLRCSGRPVDPQRLDKVNGVSGAAERR